MRSRRRLIAPGLLAGIGMLVLAVSGCTTPAINSVPTEPEPVYEPAPPPVVVVEPAEIEIIPAPANEPSPIVAPLPLPDPPNVSIVLTSRQAAYADVVDNLSKRLSNYTIYDLSGENQAPVSTFRQINDSDTAAVIALGLRAARSSIAMSDTPVVFSQVFNYQDHGLLTPNSRGIAALAPLDAHLAAWKIVDPSIRRIGAVVGDGHDELIADAKQLAKKHSLKLIVRTVSSDQEAVYQFRRMVREIDGFWLLPDNRVLSARSLQEILAQANHHNVPVAVPNESILSMGATISIETVAEDIAETIVNIIRKIEAGQIDTVPSLTLLSDARIVTNDALVNKHLSAQNPAPAQTKSE